MGLIYQMVSGLFRSGQFSQAKIDQDSIVGQLVEEPVESRYLFKTRQGKQFLRVPYHKGLRFVAIIATLIVGLTFILHYSFVYIKEVLLYPIRISINEKGALIYQRSLSREECVYLFNPSEHWADTGIPVSKNDCIRISVSGAFHPSVGALVRDAEENTIKPETQWSGAKRRRIEDFRFAIAPEFIRHDTLDNDTKRCLGFERWGKDVRSKGSGHLLLAVKDKDNNLNDNIGQIMVCIEARHYIRGPVNGILGCWLNPRAAYRWLETIFEHASDESDSLFWPMAVSMVSFVGYLLWLAAIIAFWVLLTTGGIYAFFLFGYWLKSLIHLTSRFQCR